MRSPLVRTWGAVMSRLAALVVGATPHENPAPLPLDFAGVGSMAGWRLGSMFALLHPAAAIQLLSETEAAVPPSPKQRAEDAEMLAAIWRAWEG